MLIRENVWPVVKFWWDPVFFWVTLYITVFSVNLLRSDATDAKKLGHICHQRLKVYTEQFFVFRFSKIFILTVILLILVGHIELKILTENAGLQYHTKSYAKKTRFISLKKIWQKLKTWEWECRKGKRQKIRYDVIEFFFQVSSQNLV